MPYDEQVSPESDPPVFEPPPPAARLSGILAHSAREKPGFLAPLVPVTSAEPDVPSQSGEVGAQLEPGVSELFVPEIGPAGPGSPPVDPEAEPVFPEPVPEPPNPEPVAPESPPDDEPGEAGNGAIAVEVGPGAAQEDDGLVERWCEMCGARVQVTPAATTCALRHKLSPAHAKTKRRWWQRRS